MKRLRVAAALLVVSIFLAPNSSVAQTVGVQSGEHPTFTRLVLDIGADRTWDLEGASPGTVSLTLSPDVDGFNLANVFDLIPRTRLTDLTEADGLALSLACACPVSASRYQGRYLILDIGDPSEDAEPIETAEAEGPIALGVPEGPVAPVVPDQSDAEAARRLAAAEALPDLTDVLLSRAPAEDPVIADTADPIPQANGSDLNIQDAALIMAEQLARAAASGLLQAAPGRPLSDADPSGEPEPGNGASFDVGVSTAPPRLDLARSPETGMPDSLEVGPRPQGLPIVAETAFDVALNRSVDESPDTRPSTCDPTTGSIADWSAGFGVDQGLGQLRLALYSDEGGLNPDAVLALARHYLYYGFGAEAEFWLHQVPAPPDGLLVLAALFDDVEGPHFPALNDTILCRDEDLLWRYLDGAPGMTLTDDLVGRLQRSTAALPTILRDHLAPRIARAFHRDGHLNAARNIRDMIQRGGRIGPSSLLTLDLDLGIITPGGDASTRAALAQAIRDDGSDPVGILAHALAFDRATGHPVSETRLIAAEALLRENGLGPGTEDLWLEVVLAHAARSQIERVLTLLDAPEIPALSRAEALTELFVDRLAEGDVPSLYILARVHGSSWGAEGSVAGRARVRTIALLREAGLTEAVEILRGARRTLILPARPAVEIDPIDTLRSAWLSSDWATIEASADPTHRDIAARMEARTAAADPAPPLTLSEVAATVADTEALRNVVASLLENPSPRFADPED